MISSTGTNKAIVDAVAAIVFQFIGYWIRAGVLFTVAPSTKYKANKCFHRGAVKSGVCTFYT
jgi:hypothetical protein